MGNDKSKFSTTELNLWAAYHSDRSDDNRNNLVIHYLYILRIVVTKALKGKSGWTFGELYSAGYTGLAAAITNYDTDKNIKFNSYAPHRILGSISDYIRTSDKIPIYARLKSKAFSKDKARLEKELGRPISDNETGERLGLKDYYTKTSKYVLSGYSSVDKNVVMGSGREAPIRDIIEGKEQEPWFDQNNRDNFNLLFPPLDFSVLERGIIYYYYYQNLTMMATGGKVGCCESRVCQLLKGILARLKARILSDPDKYSSILRSTMVRIGK